MSRNPAKPVQLSQRQVRHIWIKAQRLDTLAPFGEGAQATRLAVEHLGYVQIDTINVIERCHHHVLWTRIPEYKRSHLHQAQSVDKSVFEYWTHALSYVPARDLPFFLGEMKRHKATPRSHLKTVTPAEVRKILKRIEMDGPLSIRDIDDDELTEKDHSWGSRKPSKRALQSAFYGGALAVSERAGIVKTYELMSRHFGWEVAPKAAPDRQVEEYLLDRALRAQGVVSLDSVCHLDAKRKPAIRQIIEARLKGGGLVPVDVEGAGNVQHWAQQSVIDDTQSGTPDLVHILSPFDPLIIQRKRLRLLFDYDHKFEAYVPKERRLFGYFGLPVLVGDEIVAILDLKADRERGELLVQQWTWIDAGNARRFKARVEDALHRFEQFQFAA
jgi:uncharacterized protein YcaQ